MYWKVCSFWIPQRDFGKVSPFKLMEKTFWWCFVENTNSWISPYLPLRSKSLPSWSAKDAISFGLDVNTPWLSASQYTSQGLGQSLKTNDNRLASRDRQGTSFCASFSLKENNTFPKDSCCCRIRFTSQFIPVPLCSVTCSGGGITKGSPWMHDTHRRKAEIGCQAA